MVGPAHPYRGGIAAFNERLAREFVSEGHEVSIHTFSLQYPGFLFPGKTQFTSEPAPGGMEIHRTISSVNPLSWSRTASLIEAGKPDLVIFQYSIPFLAMSLGRIARKLRRKGIKTVCVAHNIVPHEKRAGDKMLTSYLVKSMDGFIVLSSQVELDLKKFNMNKPFRLSPHPLYDTYGDPVSKSEARKLLGLDENRHLVLFFGIVRDYKGLDLLLKAFDRYAVRQFSMDLMVVGEFYTEVEPYLSLIKEKSLEKQVRIVNEYVPDSEVYKYFCAADLVVQPYKHATQSGVTQIAYHFNKPMVVTNVGGLPELIPHGVVGFVVDPEPVQIADAIATYFIQAREEEFSENMKAVKKRYTWDRMVDAIMDLSSEIK